MGWAAFALAYTVFLLSHALPVRPPLRPLLVSRLGPGGFAAAYSALSLAALAWLIVAADRAPYVPVWGRAAWQDWVPLLVMPVALAIVALSLGRPNPFSFGGTRDDTFDPERAGIVRWLRHPLLAALALWALAHLPPNGDMAHVLLFGGFAAFALLGMKGIDARRRREQGPAWEMRRAALAAAPWVGAWPLRGTALRLAAALAAYTILLALHPVLFGARP